MPDPRPGPSRRSFRIVLGLLIGLAAANAGYLVVKAWRGPQGMHRFTGDRQRTRNDLFQRMIPDSGAIVFLGDSHLEHYPLTEVFPRLPVVNRGVSASTIEDVTRRVRFSCGPAPALIVVHVGINDLFKRRPVERFGSDLAALLDTLRSAHPSAPILVDELLPTADTGMDEQVRRCNATIHHQADRIGAEVLPLYDAFAQGGMIDPVLSYDGVHLNAEGYARWTTLLAPLLSQYTSTP
ncbi:MAG TPA: GDSL-type esterase/lipase family protein [Flavobacteriales bacterium]|nr:GDSL-type esterase/lipase family protein [Flavobacteriales bacterium]HMR26102.1 GDSL-type esterase/lipase family protein [Flavobacteriales bacterium]